MTCGEAKELFSPYLDGMLTGRQMQMLSGHIEHCGACAREYGQLSRTQQLVSGLGRKRAPADLALRLKVAISQEIALAKRPLFEGFLVRFENALNAFMVPATAGLISAVVIFGVLMSFFALPAPLQAGNTDVPLMLSTGPVLLQSSFASQMSSINSDTLVIEAYVDSSGRVENYRIISGREDDEVREQLNRALLFTIFAPAQSFGRPVPGKAIMSFSHINVKG